MLGLSLNYSITQLPNYSILPIFPRPDVGLVFKLLNYPITQFFLFFHANIFAARCVDRDPELGLVATRAVDHVPHQFIGRATPIEYIQERGVWILLENLFAAMFLGHFQRLVRVNLEKRNVENLSRGVAWIVGVFRTGGNAARGSIGRIAARPHVRLHAVLRCGGERSAPHRRLAVFTARVSGKLRLEAVRLRITRPTVSGDIQLLKCRSPGDLFWTLRLWGLGLSRFRRF